MGRWAFIAALAAFFFATTTAGMGPVNAATVPISPVVNEEILGRFEKDVTDLAGELNRLAVRRKELARQGDQLQATAEELHRETLSHPNMLKEARLRSLLGQLKGNLDRRAEEGRREEEQHRTFEEQVLSLAVLYNDRIENLLERVHQNDSKSHSPKKTIEILEVIGRRDVLQRKAENLRLGTQRKGMDRFPDMDDISSMDHENLLLAKGFLKDREAQLTEQIERAQLEEMELHRQIKLESKVRESIGPKPPLLDGDRVVESGWKVLVQQGEREKARLLYLGREHNRYRALLFKTKQYLRTVERCLQKPGLKPTGGSPYSM